MNAQIFDVFGRSIEDYSERDSCTTTDADIERQFRLAETKLGKTIRRKDGFVGTVTDVTTSGTDSYVKVHVTGGKDAGKDTSIQLYLS